MDQINGLEKLNEDVKIILVTGSVISGVGKGIISSSLGVLLKANGYRVSAIKIDPYINIDAGTFSPYEHGEVFVLDDGGEVDLDLGNYERFLNVRLTCDNNITTGKIYYDVIKRERQGNFLGKTVQTVPHVTDTIIDWIERVAKISVDGTNLPPHVCIVELGGTIGDVESMPYTKAFSDHLCKEEFRQRFMCVHVTPLITLKNSGELKTKPAQNGIQKLREVGLFPDLLMCRSEKLMSADIRKKMCTFINKERVINVYDVNNIYEVPLLLQKQNVSEIIQSHLKLSKHDQKDLTIVSLNMIRWNSLCAYIDKCTQVVKIALVGKYVKNVAEKIFTDAYMSVVNALEHAALYSNRKVEIEFISSELLENNESKLSTQCQQAWEKLKQCSGIVVPGGFGARGFEGIIEACKYARENKIPYLGICLGMQCAAVEFARNVCNIPNANSTEYEKNLKPEEQIVIEMPEHKGENYGMGGTMRLGKRKSVFLTENSILKTLYNTFVVEERHRHRYEVNPLIVPMLSLNGLLFVGMGVDNKNVENYEKHDLLNNLKKKNFNENDDNLLEKIKTLCNIGVNGEKKTSIRMEMCELKDHPYFVGVQYHPEYLSHSFKPSPPFFGLILAATNQLNNFLNGTIPSPAEHLNEQLELAKGIL